MRKISEYEAHADECRRMAFQAKNPEHRAQLINMAETWEMLATARTRQLRSRRVLEAPDPSVTALDRD